jgi:alpha-glucosidase
MTEFDLVKKSHPTDSHQLGVKTRHLTGEFSISVLEVWVGPEDWSDRPSPHEIPGWQELSEGGRPRFELSQAQGRLTWDGHTLLKSEEAPTRQTVKLENLRGMVLRQGDQLPEGNDGAVVLRWRLPKKTQLFGLGQRSGPLERTGLTASNWTTDSPVGHGRTTDPLYQAHPLLWGVTGDCWWALLFCHTGYSTFDLGQSEPEVLTCLTLGDSVCFQVHAATNPGEVLRSLRQTLQTPAAPPLWSFGFHQSRWGYKSSDEVDQLIKTFREKRLPLDVVHLDIDHMDGYRSFTFDPQRFPEPKRQFSEWHKIGVRVVTIIDPGLKFDTSGHYQPVTESLQGDHVIKSESGAPFVGYCWPDEALFPDFCRKRTREWWSRKCQFYLDCGVSGLWVDMNEPAIFDRPFWSGRAEQCPMPLATPWGENEKRLDHLKLRNLYGSSMSQATRDAWKERNARPWVLTRSGFTGVGCMAWSWMGDNTSWWEHLALSFPQLASMGLVNSGFVGVDIGGFFGNCDGELYAAWMEASVVYPFMRAHSALGTIEQHPWSFGPEVEEVARRALDLRYRLLPYLYTTGIGHIRGEAPPLRPMFFDFPQDQRFRFTQDQVMFGPHLMACPFLNRGQNERMVQFPEGDWFDFHTGRRVPKSQSTIIARKPGLIPLFAKAGTVIPTLGKKVQSTREAESAPWVLRHFPADDRQDSELYWDAGDGWDFQRGAQVHLSLRNQARQLTVITHSLHQSFQDLTIELWIAGEEGWHENAPCSLADFAESRAQQG